MKQSEYNEAWELLMELIEVYQALEAQFHGYINDPVDVDKEGCFV